MTNKEFERSLVEAKISGTLHALVEMSIREFEDNNVDTLTTKFIKERMEEVLEMKESIKISI
jgi:hypothetical protein